MVKIKKQLVSSRSKTYSSTNGRKYITIHETANTSKGADAQAHANLQSNGFSASWHYTVDDKRAIQSFPHTVQCWHAGDGKGDGNLNSIGIEICVNSDGDFNKAVENTAELVKKIMKEEGIAASNVVQHNKWSGKNCPANLRNGSKGINWNDFKKMIEEVKSASKSKPSKPQKSKSSKVNSYKGSSLVDYLKSIKVNSSFNNRKKLAAKHGINNYRGTPSQNTNLLKKLRGGSKAKSKPKTLIVGSKVKIKSSAKKYSRANVTIPNRFKNKTYTIQQVGKNDVLIKELYSWVRKSDLV